MAVSHKSHNLLAILPAIQCDLSENCRATFRHSLPVHSSQPTHQSLAEGYIPEA